MSDYAKADGTTLRISRLLPGPIERVWSYIADGEKRALWFTGGTFDLRVGGEAQSLWDHRKLSHEETPDAWKAMDGMTTSGTITRLEPGRLITIRSNMGDGDFEVTYELTAQGEDVLFSITQTQIKSAKGMGDFGSGWHAYIDILEDRLKAVKPRGFWSNWDKLQKDYAGRF